MGIAVVVACTIGDLVGVGLDVEVTSHDVGIDGILALSSCSVELWSLTLLLIVVLLCVV